MTRHKERELAFSLLFEKNFDSTREVQEIYDTAIDFRNEEESDFVKSILNGVSENNAEISALIEKNSQGWKINRISRVSFSILQLAVYEMLYTDIPLRVSINEAVELAKAYDDEKASAFVNGVLNSIARTVEGKNIDEQ